MNRSIEQTLLSLLPTHNSDLPEPLTQLASSLLAQSRNRASTLKAEEEVARLYACANLACDRLKISLNLPPIDPRPPIPPRIYKRLYNHLDKILPATASTPSRRTPGGDTALGSARTRTPTSKLRAQQQQHPDHNTSPLANKSRTPITTATTPTHRKEKHPQQPPKSKEKEKEKSLADLRNQHQNKPLPPPNSQQQKDPLPPWIRPTLRHLLTTLALAPPHIDIGPVVASAVESVLAPRGKLTTDAWARANAAAVVGALFLFVWRGVVWSGGEEVERERYVGMRRVVAGGLREVRGVVNVGGGKDGGGGGGEDGDGDGVGDGDEGEEDAKAWEGWKAVGVAELDAAAVRGRRHGWFEMGWVSGVQDLVDREATRVEEEEGGEENDGGEGDREVVQIRRADTMFQERYDYLGDRKRKAYVEWKEGVLKKIKALEAR